MELQKPPFYQESFLNYKRYSEARQKFLEDIYLGKTVEFNCELIGNSGATMHKLGDRAIIREVNCDCFKIMDTNGEHIYGLFKPSCFNLCEYNLTDNGLRR